MSRSLSIYRAFAMVKLHRVGEVEPLYRNLEPLR